MYHCVITHTTISRSKEAYLEEQEIGRSPHFQGADTRWREEEVWAKGSEGRKRDALSALRCGAVQGEHPMDRRWQPQVKLFKTA